MHLTWGLMGGNHQIIKDLSLSPLKREGQINQDMAHSRQGQVCRSLCHMERAEQNTSSSLHKWPRSKKKVGTPSEGALSMDQGTAGQRKTPYPALFSLWKDRWSSWLLSGDS